MAVGDDDLENRMSAKDRGIGSRGGDRSRIGPPPMPVALSSSSAEFADNALSSQWTSWLVPVFIAANVALFVVAMFVNNCPKHFESHRLRGHCVADFLGRLSFEPLRSNPLFGPSSHTYPQDHHGSDVKIEDSEKEMKVHLRSIEQAEKDRSRSTKTTKGKSLSQQTGQRNIKPNKAFNIAYRPKTMNEPNNATQGLSFQNLPAQEDKTMVRSKGTSQKMPEKEKQMISCNTPIQLANRFAILGTE